MSQLVFGEEEIIELDVRWLVDVERRWNDDRPLEQTASLTLLAREQAKCMALRGKISHRDNYGRLPGARMHAGGISWQIAGENVAVVTGDDPAMAVFRAWMNSPKHRRNMLSPYYQQTGIGVYKKGDYYYYSQLLAKPAEKQLDQKK